MFGKKKNKDEDIIEVDESESKEDVVIEDLDEDLDKDIIEEKKKKKAKEEAAELDKERDEILNSKPKTKVGKTFKMYQFIFKIIIFALLVTLGIVMLVMQSEVIGIIYMFAGVLITFSALIRLIPIVKTTKAKAAKIIVLVQCLIHLVIGGYLIGAAFYHWHELNVYAEKLADGTVGSESDVFKKLEAAGDWGWASFNITYFAYFLLAFFYTLSGGYFWVTIRYKENTTPGLFRLQMISFTLAVLLGIFGHMLDAKSLIITLAIIALLCAVYIGVEAGGSYFRYRKSIAHSDKARDDKKKKKDKGKDAPARNEDIDYSDIDPNTIPQDDPRDSNNIVN